MARCPNCEAVVKWDDPRCERCDALFAGPESWRPTPETPEEAAQIKGLYPTSTIDGLYQESAKETLPFPKWWPIVAGALLGVVMRAVFSGDPGRSFAPMMISFI